ncbi:transposase [Mycobacteroides abscessus subsp. abscessus]|nr:transposase [Mycobacteroides abscessus subsp. abscessus]
MERMLAGVATRRHARVGEPVGTVVDKEAKSTSRSAISRRFVKQTETALAELMARDLSAASSLREGLEEMFTVARLGIDGRLAKTLTTSNPVESMISIARTTNRNITRWRDGQMVLRWTAAGMLNAERSFRRIKGYKQIPQLVDALRRHANPDTATVGAAA